MGNGTADRIGQRVKHITNEVKRYVEKRLELTVLSIGEQYTRYIAESVQKIAGLVFLFGALVFLLVALALYLGAIFESPALGFAIVSVPLLITGILFVNLKPISITNKLKNEFEEELLSVFRDDEQESQEKLLTEETNELPTEKNRHE